MAGPIVLVMPALQYAHHGAPPLPALDQSLTTGHHQMVDKDEISATFFCIRRQCNGDGIGKMLTYIRPDQADYTLSQVQECKMLEPLLIWTKSLGGPNQITIFVSPCSYMSLKIPGTFFDKTEILR